MEILGKIEPSLYWEWRTTIEEQKLASLKEQLLLTKLANIEKDIEIMKLRSAIFKSTEIAHAKEIIKAKSDDYDLIKKRIEDASGVELRDCVIDEITFEIKKMA